MNWAWQQQLPPTPQLILMALADAANDQGICWPSVWTLAAKCCVCSRTVRRVLQDLVDLGLLVSEQRYRKDGSRLSNRYPTRLAGGDNLSSAVMHATSAPVSGARAPLTPVAYQESPEEAKGNHYNHDERRLGRSFSSRWKVVVVRCRNLITPRLYRWPSGRKPGRSSRASRPMWRNNSWMNWPQAWERMSYGQRRSRICAG